MNAIPLENYDISCGNVQYECKMYFIYLFSIHIILALLGKQPWGPHGQDYPSGW